MEVNNKNLVFDKENHVYTVDGKKLENITSIIDGFLSKEFFTEEARERGTAVHEAIKAIYLTGSYYVTAEYQGYIDAFFQFLEDTDFQMLLSETPLFHPMYKYAGTLDLFGWLQNVGTVVEIKTGLDHPVYQLQTAAQKDLINVSQDVIKCTARRVLQLNTDGTYKLHIHTGANDIHVFNACLTIKRWRRRNNIHD